MSPASTLFLDGPDAKPRDTVNIIVAGEKVRDDYLSFAPDVTESSNPSGFSVVALKSLVRTKLTSFRDKDWTHLRDMIDIGLVDSTWPVPFEPEIPPRLQLLIDTPV